MKDINISEILRPHVEELYAEELEVIRSLDLLHRPHNWKMSPQAVVTYLLGGTLSNGFVVEPKYIGDRRLVEVAVATLVTDRALLLLGVPGTAKTWLAEHIAAAVSGDSSLLVQGTAGMTEDALRYGWNYARLIAEGPSEKAMVPSPVMTAMKTGKIARIEELTRLPSEVQDGLITILSEKILPVPELNLEINAIRGFNVIATANDRDKGVNELSSALRRRFNTVVLPLPATLEQEVEIVRTRVEKIGKALDMPPAEAPLKEIMRLVTIFRELRSGKTEDGKTKLKTPSSTLSSAEAISVMTNATALAVHFGNGQISAADIASGIKGAVIKDPAHDNIIWQEYLQTVIRERKDWKDLFEALQTGI